MSYKSIIYFLTETSSILSISFIPVSILLTLITYECVQITNNYYRYSDIPFYQRSISCNGEIVANTFSILFALVWLVISIYTCKLCIRTVKIEQVREADIEINREADIEMINVLID